MLTRLRLQSLTTKSQTLPAAASRLRWRGRVRARACVGVRLLFVARLFQFENIQRRFRLQRSEGFKRNSTQLGTKKMHSHLEPMSTTTDAASQ